MDSTNDDPTSHQPSNQANNCKNVTCTFFGNSKFEGYCSVCYKDEVKRRNNSINTSENTSMTNSMVLNQTNALANAANRQTTVRAGLSDQIALLEQQCAEIDNFIVDNPLVEQNRVNEINQIAAELVQQDKDLVEEAIRKSKEESEKSVLKKEKEEKEEPKDDNMVESSTTKIKNNNNSVPSSTPQIEDKMTDETPQTSPIKKLKSENDNNTPPTPSTSKKSKNSSSSSKPKKRRCLICKCKIGLTGFECRCGGLFCSTHRYADAHNCSFDYKQDGKEKIRKANQKCEDDKIQRF